MFNVLWILLLIAALVLFSGPVLAAKSAKSTETLKKMIIILHPLHKPLEKPKPGDWLAKLCWATRCDPVERYKKLEGFFEKNGFKKEAEFCRRSIEKLKSQ